MQINRENAKCNNEQKEEEEEKGGGGGGGDGRHCLGAILGALVIYHQPECPNTAMVFPPFQPN